MDKSRVGLLSSLRKAQAKASKKPRKAKKNRQDATSPGAPDGVLREVDQPGLDELREKRNEYYKLNPEERRKRFISNDAETKARRAAVASSNATPVTSSSNRTVKSGRDHRKHGEKSQPPKTNAPSTIKVQDEEKLTRTSRGPSKHALSNDYSKKRMMYSSKSYPRYHQRSTLSSHNVNDKNCSSGSKNGSRARGRVTSSKVENTSAKKVEESASLVDRRNSTVAGEVAGSKKNTLHRTISQPASSSLQSPHNKRPPLHQSISAKSTSTGVLSTSLLHKHPSTRFYQSNIDLAARFIINEEDQSSRYQKMSSSTSPKPHRQERSHSSSVKASNIRTPSSKDISNKSTSSRVKSKSRPTQRIEECCACTESFDLNKSEGFVLACAHHWCNDCIKQAYEMAATEGGEAMPPRCCGTLNARQFKHLFNTEFLLKYNRKFDEIKLKGAMFCNYKQCKHFGQFIPAENHGISRSTQIEFAQCGYCKKAFCSRCKNLWHKGGPCTATGNLTEDDMKTLEMTQCAGCKKWWQKQEKYQCNHMVCHCGYEFCNLCGAVWKTCNCRQHNDGPDHDQVMTYMDEVSQRRERERADREFAEAVMLNELRSSEQILAAHEAELAALHQHQMPHIGTLHLGHHQQQWRHFQR